MADRAGFRVEGLSRVVRGLKALGVEVEDLKDAMGTISAMAAAVEARFVPRRSGRLASTVRGNRAQSKAVVTAGRATVRYAGPINYGWPARGIAAAGFQQKTDQEMRPKALQILEDEINKSVRRKGLT